MAWSGVAGKRVVISGATSGIGLEAACELARRGAHLTLLARDASRADAARAKIGGSPDILIGDLASQAAVRGLAERLLQLYDRLDVLINNAGAVIARRDITADGIERTWAVNHLAPFLLTNLLCDRLKRSQPARVITTASGAHKGARIPFEDWKGERAYGPFGFARYGQTKLANILFTRELARRLAGSEVGAYCFHPGFVASGFNHNNGPLMAFAMALARPFSRSPKKGAETLVWLADSPLPDGESGGYFFDCRRIDPSLEGQDDSAAAQLWAASEDQVGLRQERGSRAEAPGMGPA